MKSIVAALVAGAMWLTPASASPRDPLDDALDLLTRDTTAGLAALEALAADGEPEAMNVVAGLIIDPPAGSAIAPDPARAISLWERALADGSVGARVNYGTRLLLNHDPADDARAVGMLHEVGGDLADLAAYPLGRAYLFGLGVEPDLERGSRLMQTAVAAAPNNIDAQFLLGRAYQNGWGIPVDAVAAYRHLKIAAAGEDARAQWNVGMMLLNGDGVAENPVLAHEQVRASAEGGYIPGMVSMAVMLALGQGTEPDLAGARQWYLRAAEAGSAHALRALGGMLMTGEGGPVDAVTATAYLDLAAKGGDEMAPAMLQRFGPQIAALDAAVVESVKARWLREHGAPR